MAERIMACVLSSKIYDVVAIAPHVIRLDTDTEDGAIVSALINIDEARSLCRDLARAINTAMRME
jgi:hypothetical protein